MKKRYGAGRTTFSKGHEASNDMLAIGTIEILVFKVVQKENLGDKVPRLAYMFQNHPTDGLFFIIDKFEYILNTGRT